MFNKMDTLERIKDYRTRIIKAIRHDGFPAATLEGGLEIVIGDNQHAKIKLVGDELSIEIKHPDERLVTRVREDPDSIDNGVHIIDATANYCVDGHGYGTMVFFEVRQNLHWPHTKYVAGTGVQLKARNIRTNPEFAERLYDIAEKVLAAISIKGQIATYSSNMPLFGK